MDKKNLFNFNFLSVDLLSNLMGVDAIALKTIKITEMHAKYQAKLSKYNFVKMLYNKLVNKEITIKSFKINKDNEVIIRSGKYEIELSEPEFVNMLYVRQDTMFTELSNLGQQIKEVDAGVDKDKEIKELKFQIEELRKQLGGKPNVK